MSDLAQFLAIGAALVNVGVVLATVTRHSRDLRDLRETDRAQWKRIGALERVVEHMRGILGYHE